MKQTLFVIALISAVAAGCGGGSVCGNQKVEKGESCDKGELNGKAGSGCSASCQLVSIPTANVQVFYTRLANEVPGFTSSGCTDLGIKEAHVRLVGPTAMNAVWPCSQNSQTFGGVAAGDYQAFITLYDMNGAAMTKEVASPMMSVAVPGSVDLLINFAYADFLAPSYTGDYYFVPWWGAKDTGTCATAMVDKMKVTMTLPGSSTPLVATTMPTVPLDGSATDCYTKTGSSSYIQIKSIPTGHYDFVLEGLDSTSAIKYCSKLDVFVGPGAGTPTFDLIAAAATACP